MFKQGGKRPKIVERDGVRELYFDPRHIQSAMRLDAPFALELPYTRAMMAFLLFVPDPVDILIIGLGGGSLAKFCHCYLPRARITVVEIDAEVIALRGRFLVPDDDRLEIVHADALEYLPWISEQFDVILLDGFDADGIATSFADPGFYLAAAERLRPSGVLVSNLTGESRRWHRHLMRIWNAFRRRVRILPVSDEQDQYVALAFHDPAAYRIREDLEHAAAELTARFPLDFQSLARNLRKADNEGV